MLKVLKVPLAALLYAFVFHFAYIEYLNPVFEYANYLYNPPTTLPLVIAYALVAAPALAYRRSNSPAAHGAALIFVLVYVPVQLMLLFMLEHSAMEITAVQASLAASMAVLLYVAPIGHHLHEPVRQTEHGALSLMLGALTVTSMVVLVASYYQYMRLVSFADVYDLRFEANDVERSAAANYLISWLSYCFLPFYTARGIVRRQPVDIAWGMIGCVLLYMATGSKMALLTPVIMYSLHRLIGATRDLLLRLLLVMVVVVGGIVIFLPDEGALFWVKSILMLRILGTSGWNVAAYYDFFSTHGYTFYSHIGPVNAVTGAYPYGELSLGQAVGVFYTGSELNNFNANFWASDAFAAIGVYGVPLITAGVALTFYCINRAAAGYSTRFVTLWLTGFWLALLNLPLSTSLLSGGGGLTLLFLWLARRRPSRSHAAPAALPDPTTS
jgi:hypothetical protein